MNVKELKEILKDVPDDWDVRLIWTNHHGVRVPVDILNIAESRSSVWGTVDQRGCPDSDFLIID